MLRIPFGLVFWCDDLEGITYLWGVFPVEGEYPDEDGAVDGLGLWTRAHGVDQKRIDAI